MILAERGIRSTVILFGGARIPEPGGDAWAAKNETQKKNLEANSRYYEEARSFARLCSQHSAASYYREFVVVTGGGPGVMEAGNRGADDVGAPSIGLNIVLPHEQAPNPYVTPELCFNFHYFAIRKMHFVMRAKAVAVFPGGFGTMDEFFETLTLIQTGRMERVPIILFGKEFWKRAIDLDYPRRAGHDLAGRPGHHRLRRFRRRGLGHHQPVLQSLGTRRRNVAEPRGFTSAIEEHADDPQDPATTLSPGTSDCRSQQACRQRDRRPTMTSWKSASNGWSSGIEESILGDDGLAAIEGVDRRDNQDDPLKRAVTALERQARQSQGLTAIAGLRVLRRAAAAGEPASPARTR